jgi:hypothetical protein
MNKTQIIKSLTTGALLSYKKYNTLPSVAIAQAILETGWLKYVKGNNIFGIKWTNGCRYESQDFTTHEYIKGVKTFMVCKFRKYDSIADSLLDHGKLLSNSRYCAVPLFVDFLPYLKTLFIILFKKLKRTSSPLNIFPLISEKNSLTIAKDSKAIRIVKIQGPVSRLKDALYPRIDFLMASITSQTY